MDSGFLEISITNFEKKKVTRQTQKITHSQQVAATLRLSGLLGLNKHVRFWRRHAAAQLVKVVLQGNSYRRTKLSKSMWPFLKEFLNTKLKLGYILCFLAVGALFLSAQKSLAPSIILDHSIKVSRFTKDGAYVSQCSRLTPLKLSQKIAQLGHVFVDYGTGLASL